jgi:hypothetical protein
MSSRFVQGLTGPFLWTPLEEMAEAWHDGVNKESERKWLFLRQFQVKSSQVKWSPERRFKCLAEFTLSLKQINNLESCFPQAHVSV